MSSASRVDLAPLSARVDLTFVLHASFVFLQLHPNRKRPNFKLNFKGGGQECPPHTGLAKLFPRFPAVSTRKSHKD
jgi:hypothetical protein